MIAVMSLPRLRADVGDGRSVARILRGALRHEVEIVRLTVPPDTSGQHLLEVEVAGEGVITLLAELAGAPTDKGHPLHVRPVTRPQMASLLALIERLDEPSETMPPPDGIDLDRDGAPERASENATSESTIIDASMGLSLLALGASEFGLFDGELPAPSPSSLPSLPSSDSKPASKPHSLVVPRVSRPPSAPPPSVASANAVAPDLLVGRVIAGKYKLESSIGSGATAAVFRARHLDLQRNVAVKVLHGQKLGQMQFVKRFKGEALAASKLEHPNVARVIDFGQEPDGLLYLVMELLTGRSLEAILAAAGRLPQRAAVTFAIQTCSALAFAHDVGIIHRDVKPENIMIVPHRDDDGNPCDLAKVCDFGLAKLRDPGGDGDGQGPHEDLTTAGMLCGSPAYMSPEQSRGEKLDGRSDIYSLGITLYESVTGLFPHEAKDLLELFTKKNIEPPRKPSTLVPEIDPLLEDVLMRALATDPKKRHPDARVMREVIQPAIQGMEKEGSPYTGFLYAGLMIKADGSTKTLEFNCRMGDPETQPIMMRLKNDLFTLIEHAVEGALDAVEAEWDRRVALCAVMAAAGYPDHPRIGDLIKGLPRNGDDFHVFHAGTSLRDGKVVRYQWFHGENDASEAAVGVDPRDAVDARAGDGPRTASATPAAVTTTPSAETSAICSSNSSQASSAVAGGTR